MPHQHSQFHNKIISQILATISLLLLSHENQLQQMNRWGSCKKYSEQNAVCSSSVYSINTIMPQDTRAMKIFIYLKDASYDHVCQ